MLQWLSQRAEWHVSSVSTNTGPTQDVLQGHIVALCVIEANFGLAGSQRCWSESISLLGYELSIYFMHKDTSVPINVRGGGSTVKLFSVVGTLS